MGFDPFSPVSLARVNVLLVPAGKITHARFEEVSSLLRAHRVVALGDLATDGQTANKLFTPTSFPPGRILLDYSASSNVEAVTSFPFDLNRTPQVVLALVDAVDVSNGNDNTPDDSSEVALDDPTAERLLDSFHTVATHYEHALVEQLVIFGKPSSDPSKNHVTWITSGGHRLDGSFKELVYSIAASLLEGFEDLAKAYRGQVIPSPLMKSQARGSFTRHADRKSMPALNRIAHNSSSTPRSAGSPEPGSRGNSEQTSRTSSQTRSSLTSSKTVASNGDKVDTTGARYQILLGTIYLQAGRWPDALRELSEGAVSTRDHIIDTAWHSKALEGLLVCMLMFAWAQLDVNIPQVCYSLSEKAQGLWPRSGPGSTTPHAHGHAPGETSVASLQSLSALIPGMIKAILTLHTNISSTAQEPIPLTMLSETRIRLADLLIIMSLRGGCLDRLALNHIVTGATLETASPVQVGGPVLTLRKHEIAGILSDSIEGLPNDLTANSIIRITVAVASGFSKMGMERRQAFYLKTFLQRLIPELVEARKIGAAELGIHPAAALSLQSGALRGSGKLAPSGIRALLEVTCETFGLQSSSKGEDFKSPRSPANAEEVEKIAMEWVQNHEAGDFAIKLELLRLCTGVCEALPDLEAGLYYTTQLLRYAKRTLTISSPTSKAESPRISPDEQVRLLNNVKRTVAAASKLGLPNLRADYWDDFLVRSIDLMEPESGDRLIPHTPQELSFVARSGTDVPKDPFIYNPFSKAGKVGGTDTILVAGEIAYFSVLLQNPFEFDVEIDKISVLTEGCEFEPSVHNIVLGHFCSQRFILSGTPKSEGTLKVIGCKANVKDCHEQDFLILANQWLGPKIVKRKAMIRRSSQLPENQMPTGETPKDSKPSDANITTLHPRTVSITVISPQPSIVVKKTSLTQSSIMLLEGEARRFQVTFCNESSATSADLLLFTFDDSVTRQVQDALANSNLSPSELYELQLQLLEKPALRWVPETEQDHAPSIHAGESRSFTFEVVGKPGLMNGSIQADYAKLGHAREEVKHKFYTRQLRISIAITVNGSVEIPRCNILPFFGRKGRINSLFSGNNTRRSNEEINQITDHYLNESVDRHCLLLVDMRNVWPQPLSITLQARENTATAGSAPDSLPHSSSFSETLQPGHVSRSVLLVPRIFLQDPRASVPAIGSQRQFVVSASKVSIDAEVANREAFWYREELSRSIQGIWKEESTGRHGMIDFRRGIRLNARMIEALKVEDVEISFSISVYERESNSDDIGLVSHNSQGQACFRLPVNTFAKAVVRIRNRSQEKLHLLLRLQPSLRNHPHTIALDLSKRFVWSGMLQRPLHPALEPGEAREADLGLTALAEGQYEISATVEEIKARRTDRASQFTDSVVTGAERRMWHAQEPCKIDAVGKD